MKKIKSPWYGVFWIVIWTGALIWFLRSGMFDQRESIGLILVWLIFVGITVYLLVQHLRSQIKQKNAVTKPARVEPSLNAPCPCGSGKKYKRCCGSKEI
jgi:TRAP-type C4-dicarboxylate transport system permease large subunit